MKKSILSIVLALTVGVLFAHPGHGGNYKSDLNVRMWDNSIFTIKLDNHIYKNTRNLNLRNVSPGSHYVKITKKRKKQNGQGFYARTVYQGHINIPHKRKVLMRVKSRNQVSFKFLKKPHHSTHGGYASGNATCNHNNGWTNNCCAINNNNDGYGNYINYMNNANFNRLLGVIENETFDDNKLNVAKQAIAMNYLNVNQVGIIMDQFTFDDSKLEFSKMAYKKTTDRENYFLVNNKFTFSSSAQELISYISQFN